MTTERLNKTNKDLEAVKRFFVDPENPESANDLAALSGMAVLAMAEIYSTKGDVSKLTPGIKKWLANPELSEDPLEKMVGELLKREAKTRIFDNMFMGQIHPQGNKIGIISNLVGAYMNTNRIYKGVSPVEAEMETESIQWLSGIFGYDSKSGGNITTGGTTANIEALWVAREKTLKLMGTNIRKNAQPLYVLVSEHRHYSIDKACNMLGMRMVTVPSEGFKSKIDALQSRASEINKSGGKIAVVIAIAGETETGMVEDLNRIADVADKYGAFFHVDAAYGGPYIISDAKNKFHGIKRADSITIDPHKMLYTPYAAGSVIFKKEEDHLLISKIHETNYLRNVVARVEGSMGSGGVIATWATIQLLGNEGIKTLLNHNLELADFAYQRLQKSKILRPVFKPELNTILLGLRPELGLKDEKYNGILKGIEDVVEKIEPGFTKYISVNERVDGNKKLHAIRFLANHPYTTKDNVDQIMTFLEEEVKSKLK